MSPSNDLSALGDLSVLGVLLGRESGAMWPLQSRLVAANLPPQNVEREKSLDAIIEGNFVETATVTALRIARD